MKHLSLILLFAKNQWYFEITNHISIYEMLTLTAKYKILDEGEVNNHDIKVFFQKKEGEEIKYYFPKAYLVYLFFFLLYFL